MARADQLDGRLVVLVGGSGFLGTHVAQGLLARGARVRIASRHPEKAFRLKPLANLGQIQFARCDATRRESLERVLAGGDAIVSLAGAFDGAIGTLMGAAPGWIGEYAAAHGVSAVAHVSAIVPEASADADTGYAAAKREGEARLRAAFPQATILRPSVIFGKDDAFLNMFARLIGRLPVLPVFGPEARLQPVWVDDVAEAIVTALADPGAHGGKTYELGGPEVVTMMELNRRIAAGQNRSPALLPVPDELTGVFAALPGTPLSRDQWALLKAGNVVRPGAAGFAKLGIVPKPLSLFLDKWMVRYRKHGRFAERLSA